MLLGALLPSLGLVYVSRSARGRATLARTSGRTLVLLGVGVTAACGGAVYALTRAIVAALGHKGSGASASTLPPPWMFLAFGLAVGLFLALPAAVLAWADERARAREWSRRKDHVPTKEERRAFAVDLARQIRELSAPRRAVEVSVGGDGERVLLIRGSLDPQEGERLTAALRGDLQGLGFKRVEGSGGKKDWWTRV
jgi:hypothetical protein